MNIEPTKKELEFINAYFECIDFTETGDTDQHKSGAMLDESFKRESVIDCLAFYNRFWAYLSDDEISQAGHDFWLTRNGHGAGFWDGDWKHKGAYLERHIANTAVSFGEVFAVFND